MTADRTEAEVLAIAARQADERRAAAEALPLTDPTSVSDLLRERLGAQVARRTRDRGQLNLSGQ